MPALAACAVHPQATAGWQCEACGLRCPDCVGSMTAGTATIPICSGCGGHVATLTRHRAEGTLADDLPAILAYSFRPEVLTTLVATSLLISVLGLAGALGALLAFCIKWSVVFRVLRDTARGTRKLEAHDVTDVFADVALPGVVAVVAVAIPFTPLLAYAFLYSDQHAIVHGDPIAWVLGLGGAAYLPYTLIIAGTQTSLTRMLNPLAAVHSILEFGKDYVTAAAVTVGLELGSVVTSEFLGQVPYVGWLLSGTAGLAFSLTIGRLLGRVLYRGGDRVGYGIAQDYVVALLPDAPRGHWVAPVFEEQRRTYEPIELDGPPGPSIAKAMAEQRFDDALTVLKAGGLRPGDVDPALLVALAQRATGQGEHRLALKVLDSVVLANGAHPQAAKALVVAARIHAERLSDPATAAALFQRVVERFPDSDAARFAASKLAELSHSDA